MRLKLKEVSFANTVFFGGPFNNQTRLNTGKVAHREFQIWLDTDTQSVVTFNPKCKENRWTEIPLNNVVYYRQEMEAYEPTVKPGAPEPPTSDIETCNKSGECSRVPGHRGVCNKRLV